MERNLWIVLGPIVFLGYCALFFPFVADDAFIVGRYALNAADGYGLVYNLGERVSALTSPLHAIVITAFALVFDDPVNAARIVMPLLPLAGWAIALFGVLLTTKQIAVFTAFALMSPFLALWSVGGLETPILAMLLTLFAALLIRVWQSETFSSNTAVLLGVLCGLAFLTRHDSLIATMPPLMALAILRYDLPGVRWGGIAALAIAASWIVPALIYYGDPLPTSLYVKTGDKSRPLIESIVSTGNFMAISGAAFLLPFLAFPKRTFEGLRRALMLALAVVLVLLGVYALLTSGKHMMFGYRFFVPYILPLGLLLSLGLSSERFARQQRALPVALSVLSLATAAWVHLGTVNPQPLRKVTGVELEYHNVTPRDYAAFMEVLREDARVLRADADRRGLPNPTVFLFTGGTGYWMRDFYVYETLVSYRHWCGDTVVAQLLAADYVQQIGMLSFADTFENVTDHRHPDEAPIHIANTGLFFEEDTYIRYLTNYPRARLRLPKVIGAGCSATENFAMLSASPR